MSNFNYFVSHHKKDLNNFKNQDFISKLLKFFKSYQDNINAYFEISNKFKESNKNNTNDNLNIDYNNIYQKLKNKFQNESKALYAFAITASVISN
jgi:hypothetical protein